MSQNAVIQGPESWALFLDVDGTLVEIAETPLAVRVPDRLKHLLNSLCARLDGALAIVSGRQIADLDTLFAPHRFCAAGVHGCEIRDVTGCLLAPPRIDERSFAIARGILRRLVEHQPDLLLEDKGFGLALHFRRAPHLRVLVRTAVKSVADVLGAQFTLKAGKCVYEVYPAGYSKATAVAAFMTQRAFQGRMPVFVGDDVTDEDAFAIVNGSGGISVRVGADAPSIARYRLASVADVIEWLAAIPLVVPPGNSRVGSREYELARGEL